MYIRLTNPKDMVRNYSLALATSALAFFPIIASSQGTMDIGLFHNDGTLEVKVRPTSEFDGVFSSVVFALRWDKSTNLLLGDAVTPDGAPISTRKSGTLHEEGVFNYLVFAGFGFDVMSETGLRWEAGQEYTILTIPVEGKGVVELVNDEWTGITTNNADYYVSLGGHDKTGVIYKSHQELDRAGVLVANGLRQGHGCCGDAVAQARREGGSRCDLQDLLVTPLKAAIPLAEVE